MIKYTLNSFYQGDVPIDHFIVFENLEFISFISSYVVENEMSNKYLK